MTRGSISFDHAADFYDATRALPTEVHERLTEALLAELRAVHAEVVLEVGIGTGRIARPLAERGVRVCGVDIAPRMLARLRGQLGPQHVEPDLLLGDATRLPLADGSFRAIVICHILHLVADPAAAIEEMRRVLSPGGVILHQVEQGDAKSDWDEAMAVVDETLGKRGFVRSKRFENEDIDAGMRAAGAACRTLRVAEWEERFTPARLLGLWRNRVHSWTWEIPEELLSESADEVERLAIETFGDVDAELTRRAEYLLQVWSFS